ncbi:uncharacterized protein LOC124648691 [Lolium rigidum]|uniref:uncharacterized protein LOC124648691 n=1 Tax=Lolium rigidum TaxID=89674 RepID=UPI001F5CCE68|nr:uncharacterized protein LOC124648691 [Lolium rigidum]
MPLLLRRLAGAVSAPLRRPLSTARSRPPWAMVNIEAALDASGVPSPGGRARASFDLNAAPRASRLSVPARFVDPRGYNTDFLVGIVRGASCDGLLLLEYLDTRQCRRMHELDAGGGVERDPTLFVCNPLSGQLFRLPAPDADAAKMVTPFGLLTQSGSPQGSHGGPPDRYVVAQLTFREWDNRIVLRRYLSETGQWEERPMVVVAGPQDAERRTLVDHEVLAFGDRLWWVDVTWGVCSVDPFSDRPECRFVELPEDCVLPAPHVGNLAASLAMSRYRRMGFSEGKLRFVHLGKKDKSVIIGSFSLDAESCSWTLDHTIGFQIPETSPDESGPLDPHRPWVAAIDPFKANVLYVQHRAAVVALDMAKAEEIWRSPLPEKIACQMDRHSSLFHPCVLPTWLASSYIPGTPASDKTNFKGKTLAEMLVRVDRG